MFVEQPLDWQQAKMNNVEHEAVVINTLSPRCEVSSCII